MRFFLLGLLLFSLHITAQNNLTYSKARIHINSNTDLNTLTQNGIAADHGTVKENTFIESIFSTTEIAKAKDLGFSVEILIPDAKKYYREHIRDAAYTKNPAPCANSEIIDYQTPENFNLGSMGGFLTYTEMLAELDDMHDLYPNLISLKAPISDFETIENRPIYWLRISDNPNTDEDEPEMLYSAVHHAREPGSMQQLIFYMWYLLENYETDTEIQTLLNNTELYFIPNLNPDGYIHNETTDPNGGGMWRKNRRDNGDGTMGVDLNRNYSFHWGESGVSGSDGQTYPGTSGFSEPETQAMKWFCEQHNFIMALNAHTYSQLLLYPYGYDYDQFTPDHETFGVISELMVSQNGYNNMISSGLYPASGDSDDWMYGDTSTHDKIFAMTPEVGASFWPSVASIIPTCKEMVFHNLTGAKLIHNYAELTDIMSFNITSTTGEFEYKIKRLGLAEPGNFSVSIVPISSNITSIGSENTHNGMVLSEEITSGISYTLDPSIGVGATISYKLIVDNGLFQTEKIITKVFGTPTVAFFENGDTTTQWEASTWDVTTSDYYSESSSITDSPDGDYSSNSNVSIELSNGFDLTNISVANISFYAKWDLENNWDYVQFEISTDGGSSWQPQCGKFTNAGVENQGVAGQPLYDGQQPDWVLEEIDLSDYIGSTIKLRFQLVSDGWTEGDGFYFDDLKINTLPENTEAIYDAVLDNFVMYPNPSKGALQFIMPQTDKVYSLHILNTAGQIVARNTVSTNHNTLNVKHIANGVYFVKIFSDTSSKTLKLVIEK